MMKKAIMTFVLALLAALLPMQAQTITGNWIAVEEDEDAGIAYILAFEGNLVRQCVMAGTTMDGVGDVTLVIAVPAQTYTPSSKSINFTFDGSQAEIVVKDIDFTDEIKAAGDDREAVRRLGVEWCTAQCRDLLAHGVPAVHFYTMGKSSNVVEVLRNCF